MPKLLLADDSPTTQKVVQLTFADEGIDVVVADDGDTAMEMFDRHHPDIVLADINIPGLNGYEVCEAIRKRNSNGKTPVVLLAGSFEPFDVEAARRVGANDYLTKPFSSIRRLVATVAALLDTVVRADDTAHDTVEPESESSVPAESTDDVHTLPEPGTQSNGLEEPDVFSTSDIERLYTESVSDADDAVQVSEPTDGSTESVDATTENRSVQDDQVFDDELIETTYLDPTPPENVPEISADPADSAPSEVSLSAASIPVPAEDLNAEEMAVPQSQIPTVSFESPIHSSQFGHGPSVESLDPYVAPQIASEPASDASAVSIGSQLDQSGDETYFEPAVEPLSDQNAEMESSERSFEQNQSDQGDFQSVSEDPMDSYETGDQPTATGPHSAEDDRSSEPDAGQISTPWDSVAEPASRGITLDESNLLELPIDATDEPDGIDLGSHATNISETAYELTPDIVDKIAKLTATHVSEEMIREIARRVVPKVIEEVLTGRKSDQ